MTLDFQLTLKMGGRESPRQQESTNQSKTKSEALALTATILTCSAVAIQIIPSLNQTWDKLAAPWQSFLEMQLGEPGKPKKVVNSTTQGLSDVQLVSNTSVRIGEVVGGYPVTSDYGPRISPCPGCSSFHPGIDVGTDIGDPLYAPFDTEVSCPNYGGLGGLVAEFPSPEGAYTVQFLHLNDCTPGKAKKGQKIAESGTAGTGPHLDLRLKDKNGDRPIPSRELLEKVLKP